MTYMVPDWDNASNAPTAFDHTFLPCQLKKGVNNLHQHPSQLAHLQQHHHSVLHTNLASALVPIASGEMLGSVTLPGMQRYDGAKSSDRLGSSAITAPNPPLPMSNACVHEDEMLSWLRYPLEDSFDRNYCSDMFGELINPHVQLVKDLFLHQSMNDSEISNVPISEDNVGSDVVSHETKFAEVATGSPRKGIKTDAAMALGAGRAAGVLSQAGSEAFSGVRTHSTPCGILKPSSSSIMEPSSDDITTDQVSSTLVPVWPTSSAYNFSLFSRPLATTMDNLHFVGVASGPTNSERARQPLLKELPPPCDPCTVEWSGRIAVNISAFQQLGEYNSQRRVESAGKVCRDWCSSPSVSHEPFSLSNTEKTELNSRVSCVSFSGTALEASEAVEAAGSPTCLSGSSVEKGTEEVVTMSKKSTSTAQFSATTQFSEERLSISQRDVEDFPANARKPPLGPRAGKRSRAAEVHNESEKKRRNKINVRLKLLQSLIPNSNKTDKASVLDEAIEYTKMLQAQVQFMSMKAGMFFPTMVHSGMQYVLPMEQLPTVSHPGVGMGMPIGMHVDLGFGLSVSGANAASMNGSGGGIVGATCAGAGDRISVLPMVHQPFSHPCARSQLVQKRSCSPICDVSSSMPVASAPLRVAMTQQLPQGLMNVHMNANLCGASQQ